jgi:cytochrome P450
LQTRDPRALQYATVTRAEGWGPHWFIAKYFRNSFGKGLITALGPEHHKQRRVLSPAFGEAHVRALAPTFRALAAVVLPKWTEATAQGPMELDVYDWANRYTSTYDTAVHCGGTSSHASLYQSMESALEASGTTSSRSTRRQLAPQLCRKRSETCWDLRWAHPCHTRKRRFRCSKRCRLHVDGQL